MSKKRKNKRVGWIVGGTIAVLITMLLSYWKMRPAKNVYKTVQAEIGDITTYYSFSGNVSAKNRQTLLAGQMMQIREIHVKAGDSVQSGDVLITTTAGEKLKAEIDGEVTAIHVKENEPIMPGSPLAEIVDYSQLQIVFKADEYDVDALEVGKEAIAEINATGKKIRGTIREVSREGQIVNGVTFFTAIMDIGRDDHVRIGMSAEVMLLSGKAQQVVRLPMEVIRFDEKNSPYVLKIRDQNTVVRENITTGINDGTYVEVKNGVSAGEKVVLDQDTDPGRFLFPEGGRNVYLGGFRR